MYCGGAVEFPGLVGIALHRLGEWLREAPFTALGPLYGIVAADMAIDIIHGRMAIVGVKIIIMPVFSMAVVSVARQTHPGLSGQLLLGLGAISALGASMLLSLGLSRSVAPVVVMGMRHLAMAAYAWGAIATEPPPRTRFRLHPIRV